MPEWLNGTVSKTVKDVSPSRVRIPVSPQNKEKPLNTISIWRFSYCIRGACAPSECIVLLIQRLTACHIDFNRKVVKAIYFEASASMTVQYYISVWIISICRTGWTAYWWKSVCTCCIIIAKVILHTSGISISL